MSLSGSRLQKPQTTAACPRLLEKAAQSEGSTFVWFIKRVPKPLTCSMAVTAQKAISPNPCTSQQT